MARLHELGSIVGQQYVVAGEELRSRPQDFWNNVPTTALGLVKPGSVEEVSAVLAFCDRHAQPVIVEGGRTNLVHATRATPDTMLMSLERLNRLQPPDADGMTIEAEAGVVLENLQLTAQKSGLRFGLDLGSRGSATVGGVLSTNAGGFQALRYGVARDQVLGLECVLANGTVLRHLVPYTKDNSGYDLKHLFVGAEGTLGVITRAVLRLHPAPQTVNTALLAFDGFDAVVGALRTMRRALRGTLSSFEIMWREFYDFNVAAVCPTAPPLPTGFRYYVLCEAEGFDHAADAAEFEAVMAGLLESGAATDIVVAQSSRQRADIWRIREEFEPEIELFKVMLDFDVSLSISTMEAFVAETEALLAKEVYDGFVAAIGEREAKSEKIQSSFVGIDKADIVAAEMKGSEAHITLRVVSELISATRDKAGAVIDGDPETVAEVKDVWTFARDTRSRDPNWKLVATEEED